MGLIALPSDRDRPSATPIRLSDQWVKKGLILAIFGNWFATPQGMGRMKMASGYNPPNIGSTKGLVPAFGTTLAGNTSSMLDGPVLPVPLSGFRSIVAHFYPLSTGGSALGRLFQHNGGNGATNGLDSMYFSTGGYVVHNSMDSVQANSCQTRPNTTPEFNRWNSHGVVVDRGAAFNTVPTWYVDGLVSAGTLIGATGSAFSTVESPLMIGNRPSDALRTWDGMIGPLLFFDGILTAADHAALHANPFQVLQDTRRSIFGPAVGGGAQTLTPTLFTNSNSFYAPTVTPGAVTLTAGLFTNSNSFFGHTLTTNYGLVASLFTNSPSFYAPTVSAGPVTLVASLYSNASTFYAPTVSAGSVTLVASLYSNASTFYAPTVAPGAVALTATRHDNSQVFYAPVVTITGGPQYVVPGLFSNSQTFYSPSVVPGSVTLAATRLDNAQTFYAHAVSQGGAPQTLLPLLFSNAQTFFSHSLAVGSVTLAPTLYSNASTIYAPAVTGGTAPTLTLTADDIAAIVAAVWGSPLAPTPSSIAAAVWDEVL